MKYYLIAGEASGDLHASNLMAALKENDPKARVPLLGGDLMRAVRRNPCQTLPGNGVHGLYPGIAELAHHLK